MHATVLELVDVRHVACPRVDLQVREARSHAVDQREAVLHAIDRHHQDAGPLRAGGFEQVHAGGVPVEHLEIVLAQELDLVGIVVQHGHADPLRIEQAADDLAKAAKAGDQHGVVLRRDHVVRAPRQAGQPGRHQPVEDQQEQRRGHHRQRHHQHQQRLGARRQQAGAARHAKHHEGELAAL